MIRGYFRVDGTRRRPFLLAPLLVPSLDRSGEVELLVDTRADSTLLAPSDALRLDIDPGQLTAGPPMTSVGGRTPTAHTQATVTLDRRVLELDLRILAPQTALQRRVLARIPSLLGRDVLSQFALIVEDRTGRVLLLEPVEADVLRLP